MVQNERLGLYSILVNLLLVGIKGILAFLCGSAALMADTIHSFSDVISSATVLAGIKISKRKSKAFPYGLYKVENFVSLLSSIFIFLAGYEIVYTSYSEHQFIKTAYLPYALLGVLLTMVITFAFSRYELRKGEEIGSPSLVADAQHIRTDMLSSAVVFAGLLGALFGYNIDKIAAVLVMIFVFKVGGKIFIDALRVLLDASLDFETMDRVKTTILDDRQVISINSLRGRNSGPFKFIECDIVIHAKDLEKAHFVGQRIDDEIRKHVSNVDHILIHYEPQKRETTTLAVPLNDDRQLLSEHFGDAPLFYLATMQNKDGTIISESYHVNPFVGDEKGKGIKVSEWLLQLGIDTVYSPKGFKGKGPGYVFSDAEVDVIITEDKTLDEIQLGLKTLKIGLY